MDYREAERLLDRYWQGETTLEEERSLKDFFRHRPGDLPEALNEAAFLFDFYEDTAGTRSPEIAGPWSNENLPIIRKRSKLWNLRSYWEYAAIFLLLLASIWMMRPGAETTGTTDRQVAIQDTYDDPREAMIATQKALEVLAANLNRGKDEMKKLALFNKAQQKVAGE